MRPKRYPFDSSENWEKEKTLSLVSYLCGNSGIREEYRRLTSYRRVDYVTVEQK